MQLLNRARSSRSAFPQSFIWFGEAGVSTLGALLKMLAERDHDRAERILHGRLARLGRLRGQKVGRLGEERGVARLTAARKLEHEAVFGVGELCDLCPRCLPGRLRP